jgi:outer membrane protein
MKIRLGLCLLAILCGVSAQGRDLTLDQAQRLAEQHSFALKRAGANCSGAQSDLKAAGAERYPTLSLAGTASYINKTSEMNIEIPHVISLQREIGSKQRYQSDLRLNVPVFTGGRISGGIDAATATAQYYEALTSASQDQIDYVTRVEYLNLHRADQLVEAARSTQKRTGVISDNIASLFAAGSADSVDLLDARLAASKASLGVDQAMTGRRASEIKLATLLGIDVSEGLNVIDSFPDPTLEAAKGSLSDTKPELKAADANVELQHSRTRVARADFWPSLSAYGGYSYGKPNIDQFSATWNDYWTVGANLNWSFNLGGKTSRKVRASQYYLEAARNDRDQTKENLERDISLSFEQMRLAYSAFQNAKEQQRIAGDSYRLAQQQHKNGDLATNRLLEIEADLSTAEASLAATQADFYVAQSSYLYALGSDKIRKGL